MSALYDLVRDELWQAAITHIQSLADGDAADLVFHQHNNEWTGLRPPVSSRRHWNSFS